MNSLERDTKWSAAVARIIARMSATVDTLEGFPHWADETGRWQVTKDGDWTGGAWVGMLWLAYLSTGDSTWRRLASTWATRLRPRLGVESPFKAFGFYYACALGWIACEDRAAHDLGVAAAYSVMDLYSPQLGLIPLGRDAEEARRVGETEVSIDSLQASPLLFWAAKLTRNTKMHEVAVRHTSKVLDIHLRNDGSIIQSTTLDAVSGGVLRHYTHKGYSDDSTWARAQAWAMLYATLSYRFCPSRRDWLLAAIRISDWWIAHVPKDGVAYWDFDDPAIPNTPRDTSATAIAVAALLKISGLLAGTERAAHYRDHALQTIGEITRTYLTGTNTADNRPPGMLLGGCFNKRPDSRPQDATTNAELVFGTYFLLESLVSLAGCPTLAAI